jgi:hypothetical protein
MTRLSAAAGVALFPLFAATAFLSSSGTARATIVSGALTGTIAAGTFDNYGLFGPAGANLSGETISATYRYDTSAAFAYSAQSTFDAYVGTGNLTLSVTIGGATVATTGVTNTEVIDTQAGTDTMITLENMAPAPLIDFTLFAQGAWAPGVTIDAPFTLDSAYAWQTIYVSTDGSHYDVLHFVGVSAPVDPDPLPAPEPGSLVLLGAGLAGLGGVLRRRQTSR